MVELALLVEPEEFVKRLGTPGLLIVDLCRDEVFAQYHLPGAVHVNPAELISGERPAVGKLPSKQRLDALFSRIGLTPETHVVAYDDEGGGWAARLIWTLEVIGHKHMSLLNGGLNAWAALNLPLTTDQIQPISTTTDVTISTDLVADKGDVLDSLNDPNAQIWDARSAEEYAGQRVVSARGGHIPGAINLDWVELMDRHNNLRLIKNIPELLIERGIDSNARIITHCQSHHRSALTWFVGRLMGLDIKGYDGSWSEWGNDPDTPIDNPSA